MTSYYVSPTGSNSTGNGSSGNPWQTISFAYTHLVPGDTLFLQNGTYDQSSETNGYLYTRVAHSGTSGNPITFKAVNKWQAIITGGNSTLGTTTNWYQEMNYAVLDGIALTAYNGTATMETGIEMAASHCTMQNCLIYDIPGGVTGSGITLQTGQTDNWVLNTQVDHIGYNVSPGNQIHGIYMSSSYGGVVNCITSRCNGWGIHLFHGSTNCLVFFNTSFNNNAGGIIVGNDGLTTPTNTGTTVANNICMNNVGYGLREEGNVANGNLYSNNVFWGNTLGEYGQFVALPVVKNTLLANPLFVNYTGDRTGNYQLTATSPCISHGIDPTSYSLPTNTDFAGSIRPLNGWYDVGAYEYGSNQYVLIL